MSDSHVYLITGGTGSLGTALTLHLLAQGHKVRVYARNEHGHEKLSQQVPADLRCNLSSLLGAVEDADRLRLACRGVRYVVHAAAQKVIPLAEYNPIECLKTNVGGTIQVMMACLEAKVERAVLVSTDKASAPCTLYGASKLTAERVWLNGNRYSAGKEPHFVAVRYGNVWGSKGSVIHAWKSKAQVHQEITLTDPECTRFHITLDQAVAFVLEALEHAQAGQLWVPRLPSYKLGDLYAGFRRVCKEVRGLPSITGLRLAEKLHESMISADESVAIRHTTTEEDHFVLEPGVVHCKGGWSYTSGSNTWRLSIPELEALCQSL